MGIQLLAVQLFAFAFEDQHRVELIREDVIKTEVRPAGLLPLFQGLSTLRFGRSDLSFRRESASGRSDSDAYPVRTSTC